MAAIGPALGLLIANHCNTFMKDAGPQYEGYSGPLSQPNPSYFIGFCNGLANGISQGSQSISFTTVDAGVSGAPPKTGSGVGVGILLNKEWFHENLYTNLRNSVLKKYGNTIHKPWAGSDPKGFLSALCKGIVYGIAEHFPTSYQLTSTHPMIYAGKGDIIEGGFSGLSAAGVQGLILSNLPNFKGSALPSFVEMIATTYVEAIHKHSTSFVTITGICIPKQSQACGILSSGVGTGVAI